MFKAISLLRASLSTPTFRFLPNDSLSPFSLILSSSFSQSRSRNEDEYNDVSLFNRDPESPPRLFVVQPRIRPDKLLQAKLSEALNLANSLEEQRDGFFDTDFFDKQLPPHLVVQNPAVRSPKSRADTYFGPGTRAWGLPVLDRVGLIIEIFNAHAYTKEAKLQSELAALMYKKTRLVRVRGPDGRYTFGSMGEAEVVSARGRGSGGRGFISGAGETELQLQRRRISERRIRLLSQIEEVRRTRALQRASRKRHGGSDGQALATVAVVGYTNAGKSTLVSALSESDLYADDRLFATVDPRLRSVVLPSGRKVLLSDTVGFISDLPVQLVEAFHATLEEVVEADLLVHVLDSTAVDLDEQRSTVLQVLEQIGVPEEKIQSMIEIDLQEENVGMDDYKDEGEGDDSFSAAEDEVDHSDNDNEDNNITGAELSAEDAWENINVEQDDYSDGWLAEAEDAEEDPWSTSKGWNNNKSELLSEEGIVQKPSDSQGQYGPHVKTSAIMGVGLQELLQLIDEKLNTENRKKVVERGSFDRKWRPPRADDAGMAVEQ
ncbi:GTP binding domain [Dillenia turbinata]|uniref:GTP binding domain n=1 Tax=Dillenia turbinata TaxID=194707 RepID=A0AAN8VA04_9MAGN